MTVLGNVLAFQVGWFACVLGGAHGLPWVGPLAAVVIVGWHLSRAARPRQELRLILAAGLAGALLDSLLVAVGLTRYPSGTLIPHAAPYWIVAMWLLFATLPNVSLRWLKGRSGLAAMLGLLGGPLAYYGGAQLGGVVFPRGTGSALVALAVVWGLATPTLMAASRRWDGMAETGLKKSAPSGSDTVGKPE